MLIKKIKKTKLLLIILLLFGFVFSNFKLPATTEAATDLQYLLDQLSDELETKREEIKRLERDSQKYSALIESKRKEINSLSNEIDILETEISKVDNDIKKTSTEINKTDIEITSTETEIIRYEKEVDNQKVILAHLIIDMYEKTQDSDLEVFLQQDSLSEYYNSREYINTLENNTKETVDNLKTVKFNLEKKKAQLDGKKNELSELKKTLDGQKSVLDDKKHEKDHLLTNTMGKESEYKKIKTSLESKQEEAQKEIYELEEKIRQTVKPVNLPSPGSGVLAWPVANPVITQNYGPTSETGFKNHVYNFHNGTDFRAPTGTPILSAASGTIKAIGNNGNYAYGKWVLIEHNNGLTTLYGHLSSQLVSIGETVKQGDVIGLSGSTGFSTGPHLHFTVYDSSNVSVKQISVGYVPIGLYVDPKLYL